MEARSSVGSKRARGSNKATGVKELKRDLFSQFAYRPPASNTVATKRKAPALGIALKPPPPMKTARPLKKNTSKPVYKHVSPPKKQKIMPPVPPLIEQDGYTSSLANDPSLSSPLSSYSPHFPPSAIPKTPCSLSSSPPDGSSEVSDTSSLPKMATDNILEQSTIEYQLDELPTTQAQSVEKEAGGGLLTVSEEGDKPPSNIPSFQKFKYNGPCSSSSSNKQKSGLSSPKGSQSPASNAVSRWEIKMEDLTLGEQLGAGACGTVWKGSWKGTIVAIKKLHRQDEAAVSMFLKEVKIMCKLRHQNIVEYYGACLDPPERCLIMEYMPSCLTSLITGTPLELSTFLSIAKGISEGVEYLHKKNIIHRDLKPSNILLDVDCIPKVCDFGVSRESDGTGTMTCLGTPLYSAPEVLHGRHYNQKIDVYSFAMILWQMCTGKKLSQGFGLEDKRVSPVEVALKVCIERFRPRLPMGAPHEITSLIQSCWEDDPQKRPSFGQILKLLEAV